MNNMQLENIRARAAAAYRARLQFWHSNATTMNNSQRLAKRQLEQTALDDMLALLDEIERLSKENKQLRNEKRIAWETKQNLEHAMYDAIRVGIPKIKQDDFLARLEISCRKWGILPGEK